MRTKLFGTTKRKAVVGILTVILAASAGWAAWMVITASGSGTGKVGQLAPPTISEAAAPNGDLYPGVLPTGSIQFDVTNPNTTTLYLKEFTVDKSGVLGGSPQCDWSVLRSTHLALNGHAVGTNVTTFPAGLIPDFSIAIAPEATTAVAVDEVLRLLEDTPDACQNTLISNFVISDAVFSTAP